MNDAAPSRLHRNVLRGLMRIAEFRRSRMKREPHPWLEGIHTPMREELTLEQLQVSGHIPEALCGRYIRIGPNPVRPDPRGHHWFIGDGMVHGVCLRDGQARWYANRWVRSRRVSEALGEAPAPGPRNGMQDTANTHVIAHAGQTWALVEAGAFPVRLGEQLETIAHDPFGGTLRHAFSAHPHRDPSTGELHAIAYRGDRQDTVWHVVVDTEGRVRREEPIAVRHGPMIHDCMITENHVIVLDLPCTFSLGRLLAGHAFPYRWNPAHSARVGLLPREGRGADIRWCAVDPCFVFHPANAHEAADGSVIFDACVHDRIFADSVHGPDSTRVPLERWRIDPVAGRVERRELDGQSQEFPRIDERFLGREYRHIFSLALPAGRDALVGADTRLLHHDLQTGEREVHDFGPGHFPGEFVFVPRSATATEGDGWLMGYVIDSHADTSELVIMDATRFRDEPVARIHIPHRIPPGFHGNWVEDNCLAGPRAGRRASTML